MRLASFGITIDNFRQHGRHIRPEVKSILLYFASGLHASVSVGRITVSRRGARLYSAYVIINNYVYFAEETADRVVICLIRMPDGHKITHHADQQ